MGPQKRNSRSTLGKSKSKHSQLAIARNKKLLQSSNTNRPTCSSSDDVSVISTGTSRDFDNEINYQDDNNNNNKHENNNLETVTSNNELNSTNTIKKLDLFTPKKVKLQLENKFEDNFESSDESDADTSSLLHTDEKYIIVDFENLSSLFQGIRCPKCNNETLNVSRSKSKGLAVKLVLNCTSCNSPINSVYSSDKLGNTESSKAPFDINRRAVTAFTNMGTGHGGLNTFSSVCDTLSLNSKTFLKHSKALSASAQITSNQIFTQAAEHVRNAYTEINSSNDDEIIDIAVSFDGSWHRRGHRSNYGVAFIIDLLTGLVLDFTVLSKYCHVCSLNNWDEKSEEFLEHKPFCDKNYTGSSNAMEVTAAEILWGRSIDKHKFRYTTMLSDGDAKTFARLQNLKPYGDIEIIKEECVNHVEKRLGTALRNCVKSNKTSGVVLGGHGFGKLTESTIIKLTQYYGRAVRKSTTTKEMRSAIYATLFHASSTDEDPRHQYCPQGVDSWCFFNRALSQKQDPGPHKVHVGTAVSRDVGHVLLPIYNRLSDPQLLNRMLRKATQNRNESIHSVVWRHCPKTQFFSYYRIVNAAAAAAASFNKGASAIGDTMAVMGVSPGSSFNKITERRDRRRRLQSLRLASAKVKRRRQLQKSAKAAAEQRVQQHEGLTYGAGAF